MSNKTSKRAFKKTRMTRFLARCRRPKPVNIETILDGAKTRNLDKFLTDHYTVYSDVAWQEKIQLCRDLVEAGYLKAQFKEGYDGKPVFLDGEPRITISGREYLERLKQNKPWRRFLTGTGAFILGLLSSFLIKWLYLLVELFAKKHGLK